MQNFSFRNFVRSTNEDVLPFVLQILITNEMRFHNCKFLSESNGLVLLNICSEVQIQSLQLRLSMKSSPLWTMKLTLIRFTICEVANSVILVTDCKAIGLKF